MLKAAIGTHKSKYIQKGIIKTNNSPSLCSWVYIYGGEWGRLANHHFLRGSKWEMLCVCGYLCAYGTRMSIWCHKACKDTANCKKREPVWPNKFMHNNFVILFNFSHYVCAPICTSFQSSSAGTWGASRSVVWLTKWHFVNTPTQRRVKPLKSIHEKRSIQVTQYCVFRVFFFFFFWS